LVAVPARTASHKTKESTLKKWNLFIAICATGGSKVLGRLQPTSMPAGRGSGAMWKRRGDQCQTKSHAGIQAAILVPHLKKRWNSTASRVVIQCLQLNGVELMKRVKKNCKAIIISGVINSGMGPVLAKMKLMKLE
jgi:hypothetical protein